jgi:hypothetical protein
VEVDTLPADATTHVSVRARDAEGEGVTEVRAVLVSGSARAGAPSSTSWTWSGPPATSSTGWEGDLVLPQGTYHVLVGIADIAHAVNYVGTSYPHDDHGYLRLDHDRSWSSWSTPPADARSSHPRNREARGAKHGLPTVVPRPRVRPPSRTAPGSSTSAADVVPSPAVRK